MGKLSAYEIASAFPECGNIVDRELKKFKNNMPDFFIALEDIKEDYIDDFERSFWTSAVWCFMPTELMDHYEQLIKLKKIYSIRKNFDNKNINVALAKGSPIEDLYSFDKKRIVGKRIITCCPFHDEKTPSFYIYKDSNRFHCFGCGVDGDSIDFIMNLNNISFIDAVKYLT